MHLDTKGYPIFPFKVVKLSNVLRIMQKNKNIGEQGTQYTLVTFLIQSFKCRYSFLWKES